MPAVSLEKREAAIVGASTVKGHLLMCCLVLLLIVLAFGSSPDLISATSLPLTDNEIEILYGIFEQINWFGLISVTLVGDAELLGINEKRMEQFVRAKFRTYFRNIRYEDLSTDPARLARAILERDSQIGMIVFRIWVVGTDFPVVYHVRCDAGNLENPSIWSEEVLGHGSKRSTPKAIKEILDELMRQLAASFFTARGEAPK